MANNSLILNGITPWVHSYYWSHPFFLFQKMVNTRLSGELQINYIGANEEIPILNQFQAVQSGLVDMALCISSYYEPAIPEAMSTLYTSKSPSVLRKNGFYNLMKEIHLEKGGVLYLSNVGGVPGKAFRFFSNVNINIADFTNLRIRTLPVYTDLIQALNGMPINIEPESVLQALRGNSIDAYGWSYGGIMDYGWHSHTKYVLDNPFYTANIAILVNIDAWNNLPNHIKLELLDIGEELEGMSEENMRKYNAIEDNLLKAVGIKSIKLDDNHNEIFVRTAYEVGLNKLHNINSNFAKEIIEYL